MENFIQPLEELQRKIQSRADMLHEKMQNKMDELHEKIPVLFNDVWRDVFEPDIYDQFDTDHEAVSTILKFQQWVEGPPILEIYRCNDDECLTHQELVWH